MQKLFLLMIFILISCPPALFGDDTSLFNLKWTELPQLPSPMGEKEQKGLAGSFCGVHNDALILAGGINFPGKPPWEGGGKKWHNDIYILRKTENNYQWFISENKLPRPLAYGASVNTPDGVICIGGCNEQRCFKDVFCLKLNRISKNIEIESMPSLPRPLAFMSAAKAGNTIYIAGGQEKISHARAAKSFLALDLSEKSKWVELTPWNGPPRIMAAAAGQSDGVNDCFFLFSGCNITPNTETELLTDAHKYNPANGNWIRLTGIKVNSRKFRRVMGTPSLATGANHILIFGGDQSRIIRLEHPFNKDIKKEILENHCGSGRDILAYHTITDTWAKIGDFPTDVPLNTTALKWDDSIIIPVGEIRPGFC
jgi:N-acetylneuraminic acid mutarotase